MDLVVFHPITTTQNNRPVWKFIERQKVKLKFSDVQIDYPILVFAFDINDDIAEAVPIDIIEVQNESSVITLGLKKGKYQIV